LAAGLAGCGNAPSTGSTADSTTLAPPAAAAELADEDEAHDQAMETVADQTFQEVGDTSQCTDDCSGHDAGFEWAKEKGITDSSECGGKSQSFIEGCEAYAQAVEDSTEEAQEETEAET